MVEALSIAQPSGLSQDAVERICAQLEEANKSIATWTDLDRLQDHRIVAETLRRYAKYRLHNWEVCFLAAESKMRAEQRLGEIVPRMPKNKGLLLRGVAPTPRSDGIPTYQELGWKEPTVRRWKKSASGGALLNSYLEESRALQGEPTTDEWLRYARGVPLEKPDGDEWYTPAEYIEAAREVLGNIDLDPATCPEAQAVVKADRFYTRNDDGLKQPWSGRIWLNPPFSHPLVEQFTEHLISVYETGTIQAAILLVNNALDTAWFHRLFDADSLACFHLGRINFWRHDRPAEGNRQGQAFFYYGSEPEKFVAVFGPMGKILKTYEMEVSQ
jgi:phage N-6-adenine-methyltransferase